MDGENGIDDHFETEYLKQCWEDWRHYNSVIWQLPSLTVAIVGGLLGVAYLSISDHLQRAFVISISSFFALVMMIALIKHRHFQNARTRRIDEICMKRLHHPSPIRGFEQNVLERMKKDNVRDAGLFWPKVPAYYFLLGALMFLFIVTVVLAIASVGNW